MTARDQLAVLQQLPQHAAALRERLLVDRKFRSLCEDYGDALAALRYWELAADRHREARVQEFGLLVSELEGEILAELGAENGRGSAG